MSSTLAGELESIPLTALREHPDNPRLHPDAQIGAIVESMRAFGFRNPILIDEENTILAGHARLTAARRLGFKAAPCARISGLNAAEKRAYVIADNRLGELSWFAPQRLHAELAALTEFEPALLGFSDQDLARLADDVDRLELALASTRAGARDTEGTPTDPGLIEPDDPDAPVVFTIDVPASRREVLYAALNAAKERFGFTATGEALLAILRSAP